MTSRGVIERMASYRFDAVVGHDVISHDPIDLIGQNGYDVMTQSSNQDRPMTSSGLFVLLPPTLDFLLHELMLSR